MDGEFSVDSPSASDSSVDSSPATSTPASEPGEQQQQTQQQVPFHQHPRFQQVIGQNRELRSTVQQLTNRLNQIEANAQQRGGATNAEQQQYTEIAAALKKVFAADPELASLLKLREQAPAFEQATEGVNQLRQQQARANLSAAQTHIAGLVKGAGLEVSKEHMPHIAAMIARAAMSLPDGNERYMAGDHSVLTEAFDQIKPFLEALRKPATATTAQVKAKVKQLPQRPAGGNAGQPAPTTETDPRKLEQNIHSKARQMLEQLLP